MRVTPLRLTIGVVAIVFGAMQLVPYRVVNPPARHEPAWDSAQTRRLAVAACFDCHSNQTHTYWFEKVAPVSWWIKRHVEGGRRRLNFDEWQSGQEGERVAETVREGSMPPSYYTWLGLHSNARLTPDERQRLATGLDATLGHTGVGDGGRSGEGG
jgi:mono/diheme cytochrome c family protein